MPASILIRTNLIRPTKNYGAISMNGLEIIARKWHYALTEAFRSKEKNATEIYSPFGIPGDYLIRTGKRIKVIIDPPNHYFKTKLRTDLKYNDKLLLIHGCEPPEINNIRDSVITYGHLFTKVLSFDAKVVAALKNAELFCFGSCWAASGADGQPVALKKDHVQTFKPEKKFKLSFIKSNKQALPGHKLRFESDEVIRKQRRFELYFPKERIETKMPLFNDSMFHIAIENSRHDNYFTEKIIDCFMTYTLPVYWGSPNIGEYFDKNGILQVENKEDLNTVLNKLTEEDYSSRIAAMQHNYEIAKEKYAFFFDRLNDYLCDL